MVKLTMAHSGGFAIMQRYYQHPATAE